MTRPHDARTQTKKTAAPVREWLVVLRADGFVESVSGGAPVTWLGRPLGDAPGTPEAVRRAASILAEGVSETSVRRTTVCFDHEGAPIEAEILLVEALPLRRAFTPVRDLVMRTLDLFATQAHSNDIDLTIDQATTVPPALFLDGEKIAWALSTLVANAIRYARKHVAVHVRWSEDTDSLVIEVSDDGPGMPEYQSRWLFERNPSTGKAAGVALLLVRDVAAAHRGTVSVRSEVPRGSTFMMRIPRARAVSAPTPS